MAPTVADRRAALAAHILRTPHTDWTLPTPPATGTCTTCHYTGGHSTTCPARV